MTFDLLIMSGGGLDSGAMAALANARGYKAKLIFFDYVQKACAGENAATARIAERFHFDSAVITIPPTIFHDNPLMSGGPVEDLSQQSRNELKGRNLVFLALTYAYSFRFPDAQEIWIGSDCPIRGAPAFGDQKQPTFDAFNVLTAYAYGDHTPRISAPLLHFADKFDYCRTVLTFYPKLFDETFSCYESRTLEECGRCNHCMVKRMVRDQMVEEGRLK